MQSEKAVHVSLSHVDAICRRRPTDSALLRGQTFFSPREVTLLPSGRNSLSEFHKKKGEIAP
jgi:hypothetical protein